MRGQRYLRNEGVQVFEGWDGIKTGASQREATKSAKRWSDSPPPVVVHDRLDPRVLPALGLPASSAACVLFVDPPLAPC